MDFSILSRWSEGGWRIPNFQVWLDPSFNFVNEGKVHIPDGLE